MLSRIASMQKKMPNGYGDRIRDMDPGVDTVVIRLFIYGLLKDAISGSDYMAPMWRCGYVQARHLL
jgi:hypothetical protein